MCDRKAFQPMMPQNQNRTTGGISQQAQVPGGWNHISASQVEANLPEPASKPNGDSAACQLAEFMDRILDVDIDPVTLRLFILAYWKRIAKLAHEIHDDRD